MSCLASSSTALTWSKLATVYLAAVCDSQPALSHNGQTHSIQLYQQVLATNTFSLIHLHSWSLSHWHMAAELTCMSINVRNMDTEYSWIMMRSFEITVSGWSKQTNKWESKHKQYRHKKVVALADAECKASNRGSMPCLESCNCAPKSSLVV